MLVSGSGITRDLTLRARVAGPGIFVGLELPSSA